MTELSVCVPVHNGEAVIERAIRSIRSDEVPGGLEILICDDGSTDGTWAVLESIAATRSEVRLLRNNQNHGRPITRSRLLREARGRYLTWLDADDEKYPGMIAAQLVELDRLSAEMGGDPHGVLVFTNYDWLEEGLTKPRCVVPEVPVDPMRALLDSSFGGYLWIMMGLRSTFLEVGDFDDRLSRLQDLDFFIRFAELGGRFHRVSESRSLCAYHKTDVGRGALEVWHSWTQIWRQHRHHFVAYGLENARNWRRHHYRVSRRYALANADRLSYTWIILLEILYVVRGRFRRVLFEA